MKPDPREVLTLSLIVALLGAASPAALGAPPQPSLEQLGLTPAVVEAAGYKDIPTGLLELQTGAIHFGEERRARLEAIKKAASAAKPKGPTAKKQPKLQPWDQLTIGQDAAATQTLFFDQASKKSAGTTALPTAGPARRLTPLPQAEAPARRKAIVPVPAAERAAVTSGIAARGSVSRLVSLVASALPSPPGKQVCQAATNLCLNGLLRAYYGRLPKSDPSWSWAQDTVVGSFRRGLGEKTPAKVQISEDLTLLKNRGLWAANPVLPNPDGSWTMVLNGRMLWRMSHKADDLRQVIEDLDDAPRARLIETALNGESPLMAGGDLPYLLMGWAQAEALKDVRKAMAAGASTGKAQELAMANLLADPVRRKLYAESTDSIVKLMLVNKKGRSAFAHSIPDQPMWDFSLESLRAWDLLKAANSGDKDALKDYLNLAKSSPEDSDASKFSVEARKVLPYLNLENPEIRSEAEAALHQLPSRFASRLAAQGSERAISTWALSRVSKTPEFTESFLLQASKDPALRHDYRDLVSELSKNEARPFEDLLPRQGALWEKLALSGGSLAPEWLSVFDAAPEPIQRKLIRVMAASTGQRESAALRRLTGSRPWAKEAHLALSPQEIKTERLLRRAAAVHRDSKIVESSAQEIEARYKAYPQMFLGLMKEDAVVAPLLEVSRRTGMDPCFLTAAAFQEGYIQFAFNADAGEATTFNSIGPMGLDSFPDYVHAMRRRGHLRPDYNGFKILDRTWQNEAGHELKVVDFDGAASALEAMAGLLRFKEAQFLSDAKALGIPAERIPQTEREMWTYVYFNFRNPKKQLQQFGLSWVWADKGMDQDLHNAQRVGATAAFLRRHDIFEPAAL